MVKPVKKSSSAKSPLKWWRAMLGALLTFFIVVPYMMGADVEKYLHGWMAAVNQRNGEFHLELLNYKRHWFTSEGDIALSGTPFHQPITLHLKAYHGPLFFNAGRGLRLGLGFFKGSINSQSFLPAEGLIKINGPIQLTAFIPYFSDRELRTTLPAITIIDKENKLSYAFNTMEGKIDGDELLQMDLPSLTVSDLKGKTLLTMNNGLLRILQSVHLASFSVKQINLQLHKTSSAATINNLLMQVNIQNSATQADKLKLNIDLHLTTSEEKMKADFQGSLHLNPTKPINATTIADAFYSTGSIQLSAELMQALREYANEQSQTFALPLMLGFLKQEGQAYAAQIDIHDGLISVNRKKTKA